MLLFSSSLLAFASSARGQPAPLSFPGPQAFPGPHAAQAAKYGPTDLGITVPPRGFLPVPRPGPDLKVYGYLAYWSDDLGTVPWDDLTHIAIFSAGVSSNGTLTETSRWDIADDAVLLAEPYGVRVHLCVTNFDPDSLETLLSSATSRETLIDELVEWKGITGAHGVNIDFEGLPYAVKEEFVTFIADLEAAVGEVVLAGPSVDWAGSFDYDQLTLYSDIFIMGYGYHWGGSSYAGPTDPLYAGSGTVWEGVQSYSLSWSIDDYMTYGAHPDRVIMGLPLYGYAWATNNNNVPTATLGTGDSVTFAEAWDDEAAYGRNWEPDSRSPYTYGGGQQIWYGDEESVRERIAYVRDETDIAGIGFWALHYDGDDASFWDMIHEETQLGDDPPDTTDTTGTPETGDTGLQDPPDEDPGDPGDPQGSFVADAGLPFLAYVSDTVMLSATGSHGPDGVELQYRWTQISGRPVKLSSATDVEPVFRVEVPGVHTFELVVGDGDSWSEPARSFVVVIDPAMPQRGRSSCGCQSGLAGGSSGALLLVMLLRRRARR
jgi:spore germination protein YaaH